MSEDKHFSVCVHVRTFGGAPPESGIFQNAWAEDCALHGR